MFNSTRRMPFYSITFILVVVCAIFYSRAGEYENSSGILWSALSVGTSVLIWRVFGLGFVAVLIGQFGLFAGITLFRSRDKP